MSGGLDAGEEGSEVELERIRRGFLVLVSRVLGDERERHFCYFCYFCEDEGKV